MKKLLGIILVVLITSCTLGFMSTTVPTVHAEPTGTWPGIDLNSDGEINVLDAVEYMKTHYVGYDMVNDVFQWSFTDQQDIIMANSVIQSALKVEEIRDKHRDDTVFTIVGKMVTLKDLSGLEHPINSAKDAAKWTVETMMSDRAYIIQMLHGPLEWIANNVPDVLAPDECVTFSADLADYMVEIGEDWAQKLNTWDWDVAKKFRFDTSLSGKLAKYSTAIKILFALGTIVDASIKHILILFDIMQSSDILDIVKSYECTVQYFKWAVDVIGKFINDAVSNVAAAKGAAALMVGAGVATVNPIIAVGAGIAGYFVIKKTATEMLEATWEWVEDEATTRVKVLRCLNPLYKYINLEFTGDAKKPIRTMKVRIVSIMDNDGDHIIPWGAGKSGEDVEVLVENTGVRDINLRTTPSKIPANWQIYDKDWVDGNNDVEFFLKRGETKTAVFLVTSYTIGYNWWDVFQLDPIFHQGENPGVFGFKFEHDEHLEWWDIGDWFPGGIVQLFDTDVPQTFLNYVDFEVAAASSESKYVRGETSTIEVNVKNTRWLATSFLIEVSLRDPNGAWQKYNEQIEVVPTEATLDPSVSASFTVTWVVPSDALIGEYQIAVALLTTGPFRLLYIDNLEWQQVFSVYQMYIVFPTTSNPAEAGDNLSPQRINAFVGGLPYMLWIRAFLGIGDAPTFAATVGGKISPEVSITWKFAGWGLTIISPVQDYGGLYDLTITVTFDDVSTSASQAEAVKYTGALPTEPIQKGLAWLRNRQYGDGSWLGNVGVTSLTALAFLNAGYDETDATVSKAISYILSKVRSDGSIYTLYSVYETSTAILPLVATHSANYATIIENAKNWLVGAQQDEDFGYTQTSFQYGGWTYSSARGDPDVSNTQFALLALDATNLPKTDPAWGKAIIFTQRCQNRPASNDQAWAHDTTRPSYNDGGFIYRPSGWSLAGGTTSYGSMTGAGIWGLLLSGVPKTDERVVAAMNWAKNHYTWDNNPGYGWMRPYYYYLSMSKALTMYGEPVINGHDWYQELYNKIVGMQIDAGSGKGYWSTSAEDYDPQLTTAYAILALQTRAVSPPILRLSYLTFILRSNCLIRILDSEHNLVGYNYMTSLGENQIPTAVYSGPFSEPQYIVIINPKAGTYKLELFGVSEGPYTLTIQGSYGEKVTKTYEFAGDIRPGDLLSSNVLVTTIVGPMDIYAGKPQTVDSISPSTILVLGTPNYLDSNNDVCVSSATAFALTATDNINGSGVSATFYRIFNSTYDTGPMQYFSSFYLTSLADGEYSIEYYSVDNAQNIETAHSINVTLFSWNYIFQDTFGRGTTLKISTTLKLFEFTTPVTDYGVRTATSMRQNGIAIIIDHKDKELRLVALAWGTTVNLCIASSWDMKTFKNYKLIDKGQ